jgi:hypothetical protein
MLQLVRVFSEFEARERGRRAASTSKGGAAQAGGGGRKNASNWGGGGSGDAAELVLQRYRFTESRVGQKLSGERAGGGTRA